MCTGGAARFKPWEQMTDEDWAFSLANKLLGQVNVVRYGAKSVRPGGAITLTTGLAAQYPSPGSAIITTVNAAVEAFVRAVAAEPSITVRVN
ncbi:MAG: SDR family oxidoreductase, partial [Roseiarcus sp.]|uniref:SDR family oxidoreductase n=1 Tax=Roseiarcus sp. TaxID=1969460 RepID=UPI003BB1711E